jgi:polysaccharide chain length determinant protein (PEP-CTERM system associated)
MFEALKSLLVYLRSAWRYRWIGVGAAWAISLLGWTVVALIPNTYEAHARIYVDAESVLRPLLTGLAVGSDVRAEASSVSRVIVSRPNLERVARDSGIIARATDTAGQQRMIDSLGQRVSIARAVNDGNLYTVSFVDVDPVMSQRVVDLIIKTFVEDTLGIKRADNTQAQQFLTAQIAEYEVRLREAEERLAAFKRRNVGLMPSDSGDYYQRLQAATTELEAVQSEYRMASSRREELLRQLEGEEPTVGLTDDGSDSGVPTTVDSQISATKARLEQLLLQYTDKHPEVVTLRETIQRLESERAQQVAARKRSGYASSAGTNPLNINPVYQSMRIGLSQTELQLIDVRTRLARAQSEVGKLRGLVSTVPEVESELVRLNRDYEVTRQQHQQLLQRLESARLTQDVETTNESTRFRVVEPPEVPTRAVGPWRTLLNSVVPVFALALGAMLTFLLSQLNPVFSTRRELQTFTGLPVFGSVSLAPGVEQQLALKRQPQLVLTLLGILLAAYVGVMALSEWMNSPLARSQ